MSYNTKQYNTRHSGRYNTPGQFIPAGEQMPPLPPQPPKMLQPPLPQPPQPPQPPMPTQPPMPPQPPMPTQPYVTAAQRKQPPLPQSNPNPNPNLQSIQTQDVEMKPAADSYGGNGAGAGAGAGGDGAPQRPHWMKSKLAGVKKVSNKERRRRQNENLRRLITPKNALMVLNEMLPGEQVNNQFKVEPASNAFFTKSAAQHSFCADLTIKGNTYKGYGENKLTARNVAAEQAIRDLIIQKMGKAVAAEGHDISGGPDSEGEEALPMIQLASFALHKLFSEWEYEGHKVPQLKPASGSISDNASDMAAAAAVLRPKAPKKKDLPPNAADMHPCMLLTFMRPLLEYRELAVDGDRPQNMVFTLGVDVDGSTYIGKASNKKEARKQAAKAACQALFGVRFNENVTATPPKMQLA